MNSLASKPSSSSAAVFQSGQLVARNSTRAASFDVERWVAVAALVLASLVLAIFVAVLEQDVQRGEIAHARERSGATASSVDGGQSADAAPENAVYMQDLGAHAMNVPNASVVGMGAAFR